jgi:serine/threonine protein kinase
MDNLTSKSTRIFKTGYVLNDKWVIIEFIDKGAMGEVYRAHQLNLKRDVAIKVISLEMLASLEDDPEEIETAIQRFRREVQAMARVRHHNVLQILTMAQKQSIKMTVMFRWNISPWNTFQGPRFALPCLKKGSILNRI